MLRKFTADRERLHITLFMIVLFGADYMAIILADAPVGERVLIVLYTILLLPLAIGSLMGKIRYAFAATILIVSVVISLILIIG